MLLCLHMSIWLLKMTLLCSSIKWSSPTSSWFMIWFNAQLRFHSGYCLSLGASIGPLSVLVRVVLIAYYHLRSLSCTKELSTFSFWLYACISLFDTPHIPRPYPLLSFLYLCIGVESSPLTSHNGVQVKALSRGIMRTVIFSSCESYHLRRNRYGGKRQLRRLWERRA